MVFIKFAQIQSYLYPFEEDEQPLIWRELLDDILRDKIFNIAAVFKVCFLADRSPTLSVSVRDEFLFRKMSSWYTQDLWPYITDE